MAQSRSDEHTPGRYRALAPLYDLVSLEHLLYREGRKAAVHAAHLEEGQCVLDVGCGTGLTMPLIAKPLGPHGQLVGIDPSPAMLAQARKRHVETPRTLIHSEAHRLSPEILAHHHVTGPIHVALFCYTLSVMSDRTQAWDNVLSLLPPGARIVIVDVAPPTTGGAPARLMARILARIGGSDIDSRPWKKLQSACTHIEHHNFTGGHVQMWAGNLK
ncbi:methyltransferase domain-containing protein [Ornithinimicrobium sp. Arc0846-15]|nr:methyltransferase domain-containing protein [Ornithinimicrobium laminariae]